MKNSQEELLILKRLCITPRLSKAPKIIEVNWLPPSPGFIKINTDGAAYGCPGPSGAAGIFRTSRGFVKGCFAIPLGTGYAFEAELAAVIHAIHFAWDKGWLNLWLETDSTYIAYLCKNCSAVVPWRWRPRWVHCLKLIKRMNFHVSHIFREGNRVADNLASKAASIQCPTWWSSSPNSILPLLYNDWCNRPSYRFKS